MGHREKGFSLIEVVVVVAIIGIVLGIATPMFSEGIALNRVRSVSFDLYSSFVQARSEAIARNATVSVSKVGSGATGWTNGWSVTAAGATLDQKAEVTGLTVTGPDAVVSFDYTGRANGGVNFNVVSSRYSSISRCVTLDLSGRPYIKASGC